jgi:hypothetical protein
VRDKKVMVSGGTKAQTQLPKVETLYIQCIIPSEGQPWYGILCKEKVFSLNVKKGSTQELN